MIMKKFNILKGSIISMLTAFILLSLQNASAQQKETASKPLPADLNKFFLTSCVPCHTSKGGVMSKSVVNFDEWSKLTGDKQSSKAEKISGVLEKGKMPPKSAREKRPEIVPTKEQIAMVQKWAESLQPPKK